METNTLLAAINCTHCKASILIHDWDEAITCPWCHALLEAAKTAPYIVVYCQCCRQSNMVQHELLSDFVCPCTIRLQPTAAQKLVWTVPCEKCQVPVPFLDWDRPVFCQWCHSQLPAPQDVSELLAYCRSCRTWNKVRHGIHADFSCPCTIKTTRKQKKAPLLAERYELLDILGIGSTGEVWKATDTKVADRSIVAIKFIREGEKGELVRAKREADALSRLEHPGVIRIYSYLPGSGFPVVENSAFAKFDFSCNTACIVMKYIAGGNLAGWLDERTVTPLLVAEIFIPIYEALQVIHDAGVVHRDLKLTNILMDGDRPIITDFGLSRLSDATSITNQGTIMGTIDYISPEQARGKRAEIRSDLYATAAMMWKIFFNKPVFEGNGMLIKLRRISRDPIPHDIETLPRTFQYLLRRLLAKNPQLRFAAATEVQRILTEYVNNQGKDTKTHFPKPDARIKEEPIAILANAEGLAEFKITQEKPKKHTSRSTRRLPYRNYSSPWPLWMHNLPNLLQGKNGWWILLGIILCLLGAALAMLLLGLF